MTPEQIAARFEFARPGFSLVGYQEVSLPIYRLRLRGLVMERRPLNTIHEFVLKAIKAGLSTAAEITALLGLTEAVLNSTLAELVRSESVHLASIGTDRSHAWALTSKGLVVLEAAETTTPEEVPFEVDFDGLTHQVSAVRYLDKPRDVVEKGSLEIPASPNRPPELDDIPLAGTAEVLRAVQRGQRKRDLLALLRWEKRDRFYADAVALIFRAEGGGRIQVALAVDGRLSEAHEAAFANANLPERLGMDVGPSELPMALDEEVERQALELRKRVLTTTNRVETARERLNATPPGDQKRRAEIELKEADQESQNAVQAQNNAEIRLLSVFEHPPMLNRSLEEAQRRVLIVSPWLHPTVVNRDLIDKLKRALRRGVLIYIGYGIAQEMERRNQGAELSAEASLKRLAAEATGLNLARFGDTHAKVLAWDSSCVVNTSFNWLSFKGDRSRGYRDERGIAVSNAAAVDQQFRDYLHRFEP